MLKRLFDLIFTLVFIPIWFPLIIIIMIISMLFNGLPIFFLQYRGGYKNKKIKIIKFRTFDSNNHINIYSNFLRFFKFDELPQLINILKGDISLVGPRPLHYEYKKLYKKKHLKRFNVLPGITGWSQVKSNDNTTWSKKFEFDSWYVDNHNLFLDLKIIILTIKNIILSVFIKNKKTHPIRKFNGSN
jgi:lipopolysaccharide/colanic/teichoic acid biosynthesis glycosyltransferase